MILIDDRAGSGHLHSPISARGIPATLTRLDFADVAFDGSGPQGSCAVGIELKRLDDLINSFQTRRFQAHQLPGMLQNYQRSILLVEGIYREAADGLIERGMLFGTRMNWLPHRSRMTYQRLEAGLHTLQFCAGVTVLKTRDTEHTIAEILRLYHWWQKPWGKHDSHKSAEKLLQVAGSQLLDPWFNRRRTPVEEVAMRVPGLGVKRVGDVARAFRSVRRMAWANEAAWRGVAGIGPKLAQKAVAYFKEER